MGGNMHKKRTSIIFAFAILFCFTGCTLQPAAPATTLAPTVAGTLSPTATSTATVFPSATPTEQASFPTASSGPQWQVNAVEIPDWLVGDTFWKNEHGLEMSSSRTQIDLHPNSSQEAVAMLQPIQQLGIPEPLYFSPRDKYVLSCGSDRWTIFQTSDARPEGNWKSNGKVCSSVQWAQDESVVAILTDNPAQILVWKLDSAYPQVAKIPGNPGEAMAWSPNSQKLAIATSDFNSLDPNDEFSYAIVYADGRPPRITHTGLGPTDEMFWLTNNIIYTGTSHGCQFFDYIQAETGTDLLNIDWMKCSATTQDAALSPNQRWLVLERTDFLRWPDFNQPPKYQYILYDFNTGQSFTLFTSTDTALDFIGWSADSTKFYMNRRSADPATPLPEEPYSTVNVIDPVTQQFQPLTLRLTHAWLSPNGNYLLGLLKIKGIDYLLFFKGDGTQLTAAIPIAPDPTSDLPIQYQISLAWSNDGSRVAYRDGANNLMIISGESDSYRLGSNLPAGDTQLAWSPDDNLLFVQAGQQAWVLLPWLMAGQRFSIANMKMGSESYGQARTVSGHILRTYDGGSTWQDSGMPVAVSLLPDWPAYDTPFFLDNRSGWRVDSSQLQHTADGGAHWTKIAVVNWPHSQFSFVDEETGWAVVQNGEIFVLLKTTDGGKTWHEIKPTVVK
jgi:hypothetical protein